MAHRHNIIAGLLLAFSLATFGPVLAQPAPPVVPAPPAAVEGNLYAIEFRTGPGWNAVKPAHEQAYFREHSANLKRLRDQGSLLVGARYSDKGFIIVRAASKQEVDAMISPDPSVQNGVFAYETHEFNVFYPGTLPARQRRP